MQRTHKFLSITFLSLVALCARGNAVGGGTSRVQGHMLSSRQMMGTERMGRRASRAPMNLTVALKPRDQAGIDDLIKRQNDPSDPLYHHYLSNEEYKARFSPTDAQVQEVVEYLELRGVHVANVHGDNMILEAESDTATTEDAFQIQINEFEKADGELVFAPNAEPLLTDEIAPRVSGVVGLNNLAKFRSHTLETRSGTSTPASGGFAPADIRAAYGISSGYSAAGQSVALFQLDSYTPSDIDAYRTQYGIPLSGAGSTNIVPYYIGGASSTPGDGASEVTLDTELVLALAPQLDNIFIYMGVNTDAGALATYSQIATDNTAKSVSSSWGIAEDLVSQSYINSENTIFQKMATQGQSMYAASGDYGAYDDQRYNPTKLDVDDPASQPYVTGVGGTTLASKVSNIGEVAWSNTSTTPDTGGGGGISTRWAQPSFQQGLGNSTNLGSTSNRMVPDVALHANPNNGYNIYFDGGWHRYGGTSCAAPLWAAFTAVINRTRVSNGLGTLGFANAALYALAGSSLGSSVFHDITSGNNLYYPATTGYDLATGLGSFNGDSLFNALTASAASSPPAAPSTVTGTSTATMVDVVTWSNASNASAYDVYRSTAVNGTFDRVGTSVTTNTFTETVSTYSPYYYYYVRSVNGSGTSAPSTRVPVAPYVAAPSAAPTNLSATVTQ